MRCQKLFWTYPTERSSLHNDLAPSRSAFVGFGGMSNSLGHVSVMLCNIVNVVCCAMYDAMGKVGSHFIWNRKFELICSLSSLSAEFECVPSHRCARSMMMIFFSVSSPGVRQESPVYVSTSVQKSKIENRYQIYQSETRINTILNEGTKIESALLNFDFLRM